MFDQAGHAQDVHYETCERLYTIAPSLRSERERLQPTIKFEANNMAFVFDKASQPRPSIEGGLSWFPLHHMRGGTSTGVVLHEHLLPADLALREELIRHVMGVPQQGQTKGNRQVSGLGRGPATSNKVFIVAPDDGKTADIRSTLAQLAADRSTIDWSVNCGNMSAALPLFAIDTGLFKPQSPVSHIRIYNTNTQVITDARLPYPYHPVEIDGVVGSFPEVFLSLRNPVGAKTGKLLPTGHRQELIDGIPATCLDVAVPMVIMPASAFGLTADESPQVLAQDSALIERLRTIWVKAGLAMGLKRSDGRPMTHEDLANSETIPKVCLVAPGNDTGHLKVRYFTPQQPHASMAVTGACCLAAAALLPGTVAHEQARGLAGFSGISAEHSVRIEHPAGLIVATVNGRLQGEKAEIPWAAYQRSAQILMKGMVPIYQASDALKEALAG